MLFTELSEQENELLTQSEILVDYVIKDLEDYYQWLSPFNSKERITRCLTTLAMVIDKISDIKEVSEKRFTLKKEEVAC